jgi:hypothetical protein
MRSGIDETGPIIIARPIGKRAKKQQNRTNVVRNRLNPAFRDPVGVRGPDGSRRIMGTRGEQSDSNDFLGSDRILGDPCRTEFRYGGPEGNKSPLRPKRTSAFSNQHAAHTELPMSEKEEPEAARGPKGGIKHQPGRGHVRKSAKSKKRRFARKAARKRRE